MINLLGLCYQENVENVDLFCFSGTGCSEMVPIVHVPIKSCIPLPAGWYPFAGRYLNITKLDTIKNQGPDPEFCKFVCSGNSERIRISRTTLLNPVKNRF